MEFPFTRLSELEPRNTRVLVRVDYNTTLVPGENGTLRPESDGRLLASLPTITYLLRRNCSVLLLSYLKRPEGKIDPLLRMAPVAERLSELLKRRVDILTETVGPNVDAYIQTMKPGQVALLENVRFNQGEFRNSERFAKQLAALAPIVVFDAFAQSHRRAPSTSGLVRHAKRVCAGKQLELEYRKLRGFLPSPTSPHTHSPASSPFVAILGGAKISDKLDVLQALLKKANSVLIGGALANTLLSARGVKVGNSLTASSSVTHHKPRRNALVEARKILRKYGSAGFSMGPSKLFLPVDMVAGPSEPPRKRKTTQSPRTQRSAQSERPRVIDLGRETIPADWAFYDIGPKTLRAYQTILKTARTIFWNGPMGWFERAPYGKATRAIATTLAGTNTRANTKHQRTVTVIGGGDTEAVLEQYNIPSASFTHVSTGGGATLQFITGRDLPALTELSKRRTRSLTRKRTV